MEPTGFDQLWMEMRNGEPAWRLGIKHVKMGTLVMDSNLSMKGSAAEDEETAEVVPVLISVVSLQMKVWVINGHTCTLQDMAFGVKLLDRRTRNAWE